MTSILSRLQCVKETWRYICSIYLFLDTEMVQLVEILPHGKWHFSQQVDAIAANDLVNQEPRASAAIVLIWFFKNIPVCAQEELMAVCFFRRSDQPDFRHVFSCVDWMVWPASTRVTEDPTGLGSILMPQVTTRGFVSCSHCKLTWSEFHQQHLD